VLSQPHEDGPAALAALVEVLGAQDAVAKTVARQLAEVTLEGALDA